MVFYLDKGPADFEHTQMAALGSWVWKRADGRDSLFQECLGHSAYHKGQGIPIRVFGVLAEGKVYLEILETGEAMNEDIYVDLTEDNFAGWLTNSNYLVCDFEKCLRCPGALAALERIGVELKAGQTMHSVRQPSFSPCCGARGVGGRVSYQDTF